MFLKIPSVLLLFTITLTRAGYVNHAGAGYHGAVSSASYTTYHNPSDDHEYDTDHGYHDEDYDDGSSQHDPPKYEFKYGIEDPHTGDSKTQYEVRDGEYVRGRYSLVDADGTIRTVEYTSDPHHGFRAVVHRTGQESVAYGHHD